jgi:hypothetical protein
MTKHKYVFGYDYYDKALRDKHRALIKVRWIDNKAPWTSSWKTKTEMKMRRQVKCISKSDISSIKSFVNRDIPLGQVIG